MTWLEKISSQMKRVMGVEIAEGASEAEVLTALEAMEAVNQNPISNESFAALEAKVVQLQSKVDEILASTSGEGMTPEAVNDLIAAAVDPLSVKFETAKTSVDSLSDLVSSNQTKITAEISAVKLNKSIKETPTPTPVPSTPKSEKGDKNGEMEMKDFMSGSVVAGLGIA